MTERERMAERLRLEGFGRDVDAVFYQEVADFVLAEIAAAEQRGAEAMRERCAEIADGESEMESHVDGSKEGRQLIQVATSIAMGIRALAVPAPATDAGEKETANELPPG